MKKKGKGQARVIQTPEALKNQDILNLIFEHFYFQPGSHAAVQSRKDLLSAAKTCKAFLEPALNSLWRVLPSLLPLFLLLPSAEVINNRYFVDKLPLSNWERFDMHASRVRTLYLETLTIEISPYVYLRISSTMRYRHTPLLPSLKNIYIPKNTSLDFSSALLLASESSLNLVQLVTSDRQIFIPFLSLLSVNSPDLAHLALCGTMDTSLELVPGFKNLQSLELKLPGTYLGSQILQDLGELDNLLNMTLDTSAPIHAVQQDPTPRPDSFIKLKRLQLLGSPHSITRVLGGMNILMNLTTLIIYETTDDSDPNTESSRQSCFSIISTFLALEDIEIIQSHSADRWHHYALSTSCLSSLYKLPNVTSFVINNSTLSGSDDDFLLLACAFPKLKKFVEPCVSYYSEGRTLASLLHFSQINRDLREIKISLSSNISENLKAINVSGRPILQDHQHPLEKLYIASSFSSLNLADMIRVAQFLDLIFPNLSTLEAYDSSSTHEALNWTQIQQIRVALRAARINASTASKICEERGEHGM